MEEHKERLTLGVDAETKRRLKAAASEEGGQRQRVLPCGS